MTRRSTTPSLLFLLLLAIPGCGLSLDFDPPDPVPVDAGPIDAPFDAPPPGPCEGAGNGTECGADDGAHRICVDGECRASVCGDSIVDAVLAEECDDGNEQAGDGCEPFACVFTCENDVDCDDGQVCNGAERCSGHVCEAGVALPDGPCVLPEMRTGRCEGGVCVLPSCGDGVVDDGEDCDFGDLDPGDGCEPDCTLTCTESDECSDGDPCNGIERCDVAGCELSTIDVCPMIDACHASFCDGLDPCVTRRIDLDRDGHSPERLGECGDDCDDMDPGVHGGAPERCNGSDDDCDGVIDEEITMIACFPDADGDGFGDEDRSTMRCDCEAGDTTIGGDCHDARDTGGADVFPGQTMFFGRGYCDDTGGTCGFDYDCDGAETPLFTRVFDRCVLLTLMGVCVGEGWDGGAPACGEAASWVECDLGGTGPGLLCRERRTLRVQPCR